MAINSNSQAPATGSSLTNKQFSPTAENVDRKIMIVGTYLASITGITDEVPVQITGEADAGSRYGFGSMIHRLAVRTFSGGNGVPTWVTPQAEAGGAVAASGTVTFSGTSIGAGTLAFYVAGLRVAVSVASGATPAEVATALVAAITADKDLPISAVVNATPEQVDITSKSKGTWGNFIDLSVSILSDDADNAPANLVSVIVDMASGTGIPDISDALNGMGLGDNRNSKFWTGLCHGYGQDTTTMDAIATWVGLGNTLTGLYDKLVHRPIRVMDGDNTSGSSNFNALIALGDGRKQDRANGLVSIPGSESHPSEIGAWALGYSEFNNNEDPNKDYENAIMVGIRPGVLADEADRFTNDHDNRDSLAKAGISSTVVKDGVVYLQNLKTYYHRYTQSVYNCGTMETKNYC
jgi:phage tail sheath gpL-like